MYYDKIYPFMGEAEVRGRANRLVKVSSDRFISNVNKSLNSQVSSQVKSYMRRRTYEGILVYPTGDLLLQVSSLDMAIIEAMPRFDLLVRFTEMDYYQVSKHLEFDMSGADDSSILESTKVFYLTINGCKLS